MSTRRRKEYPEQRRARLARERPMEAGNPPTRAEAIKAMFDQINEQPIPEHGPYVLYVARRS